MVEKVKVGRSYGTYCKVAYREGTCIKTLLRQENLQDF